MFRPFVREARCEPPLPPIFARMAACFLGDGEAPLATLFVPPEEIRKVRTPARALVLIARGVLFMEEMEESEAGFPNPGRGIKSLFYSYAQVRVIETGAGRFLLHGLGDAPVYEIAARPENRERFREVARLIGKGKKIHVCR